jgi:RNA polymerase sigma-70 factor (ECF subfamily)
MHDETDRLPGSVLGVDAELEREFEARVSDSLSLAFRVAYSVLRSREDAQDVAQEAFVSAHHNFRHLRDRDAFRAWLIRITWRLALKKQRTDRRRVAREVGAGQRIEVISPAAALEQKERAAQLWEAIDALPPKLRLVTVLAGIQEHDIPEIAVLLGIPSGTVKSRLFLARQRMKEALQWTRIDPSTN